MKLDKSLFGERSQFASGNDHVIEDTDVDERQRLLQAARDELIGLARRIADEAVRRDPDQATAGFADAVTQTERMAAADWLEGT